MSSDPVRTGNQLVGIKAEKTALVAFSVNLGISFA